MRRAISPMTSSTRSVRRAGFTLIELMVVVALISIMLVIAVPSFASFISNYRVTGATNDFLQGITLTRTEALKRSRRVLMLPRDATGAPSATGNWKNGWAIFAHTGVPTIAYNAATDTIIFQHDSLPVSIVVTDSGGGSFPFQDGASQTYVSFDGTGYARQQNGQFLAGSIVLTETTVSPPNIRTLCLASFGRPRIVVGTPGCASG